jgi:hypothetical protein
MSTRNRNAVARKRPANRSVVLRPKIVQLTKADSAKALEAFRVANPPRPVNPMDAMISLLTEVFPPILAKLTADAMRPAALSNAEYVRAQVAAALRQSVARYREPNGYIAQEFGTDGLLFIADVLDPALLATA